MAQFATAFVPFALQAATSAWQQYEYYDRYQRQQQAQAAADQAGAQAARQQAEAQATRTADSATQANRAAWQEHDAWAAQRDRDSAAAVTALNRDFARTELERADALRRQAATERARFAGMGLDAAAGSARAVLSGLTQEAATQTRRDADTLTQRTGDLNRDARADIAAGWDATARETADRAHAANLDIWQRQVDLDSALYARGVRQDAFAQRDLLDLSVSHQRAALGLVDAGIGAVGAYARRR
ncbi:hypothetical protein F1188_10930 [Roseospira marina]|uniref:Uncharacterized protein n=1 Tax=Roseospira marina TaxID=140057 RepID=A0A5M6IAV2_9PROT|nr:hypothetical protein [Roseospira marina]KAA5605410.1 hypothetical protein F1188_10930 [Roseospira marina]MBB4314599.1 ribosomal protein L9 [Roseospira marina]MBB5088796.1 ribosomal protein L9 [Roseospira marina]